MIPIQFPLPKWLTRNYFEVQPLKPKAKIAIVVGHNRIKKGAFSKFFKSYEWDFNKRVVEMLQSNVDVYFHANIFGYTSRQRAMAKKLNKKNYKLVMELHFNAADPVANGVECFYYFKNNEGKKYAQLFNQIIVEEHGLKNRGAKALLTAKDRGYGFVYYPKATAILLEPGFGTNARDCIKIKSELHLARSIDRFVDAVEVHKIAESFGMP